MAHGEVDVVLAVESSFLASLSAAECTPSPPVQPFESLLPTINSSTPEIPMTLGPGKFPSQTEVTNYWSTTVPVTEGKITGSENARETTLTSSGEVMFTPTATGEGTGGVVSTSRSRLGASAVGTGTGSAKASQSSSHATNLQLAGGVIGLVAVAGALFQHQ